MATVETAPWPAGAWRQLLADAVSDLDELLALLDLDSSCLGEHADALRSAHSFALRVPRGFVGRMRRGDPDDPLLRQVLPYYLHMLDPVEGAAHFEVSEERARLLQTELTNRLPGYLVPRLVREVQGAPAKEPVRV